MSDEQDKLKLSLEPPKLFGRKKKPAEKSGAPAEPSTASAARPTSPTTEVSVAEEAVVEEPVLEEPTAVLEAVEPEPEP
ncbi:hypothetical protein ACFQRR_01905, partial [Nocardioides sp. GCM10030258]